MPDRVRQRPTPARARDARRGDAGFKGGVKGGFNRHLYLVLYPRKSLESHEFTYLS